MSTINLRRTYTNKGDAPTGKMVYYQNYNLQSIYSTDFLNSYNSETGNSNFVKCSPDGKILFGGSVISKDYGNTYYTITQPDFVKTTSQSVTYFYSMSEDFKRLTCIYKVFTVRKGYYTGSVRLVFSYDYGITWQDDTLLVNYNNVYSRDGYFSQSEESYDGTMIFFGWNIQRISGIDTSVITNGQTVYIKSFNNFSGSLVCNYDGSIYGYSWNYSGNIGYYVYSNSVTLMSSHSYTINQNHFYLSKKGNILVYEYKNNSGDTEVYDYYVYKIENDTNTLLCRITGTEYQYLKFKLSFNGAKIVFLSQAYLWNDDSSDHYLGFQLNVLSTDNPSFNNTVKISTTYATGYIDGAVDISSDGKYIYFIGLRHADRLIDIYKSDDYGNSFTKIFSNLSLYSSIGSLFTNKDLKIYE